MRTIAVIPARYASTRLPGKMLAELDGVPLIVRTLENARRCRSVEAVLVATDDQRIADAVTEARGEAVMTDPALPSGSDRVRAALADRDVEIVVNLQGDEPALPPETVDATVQLLRDTPAAAAATAATPLAQHEYSNPNVVKLVRGTGGRALYFSRAPIPWSRDGHFPGRQALRHIGMYVYRRQALVDFCKLPPSPLEQVEQLEQLRMLEAGMPLHVHLTDAPGPGGVDTADDLERVRAWYTDRRG